MPADATPPVLHVPANIVTNATSPQGAAVTYAVTATDDSGVVTQRPCRFFFGAFPLSEERETSEQRADNAGHGDQPARRAVIRRSCQRRIVAIADPRLGDQLAVHPDRTDKTPLDSAGRRRLAPP